MHWGVTFDTVAFPCSGCAVWKC